jgi:hypothetical protein
MAKEENAVSLQDVYEKYAKSATAKEPKIVSLLDTHTVKFTADFKGVKAGTIFKDVSQVAFDFYMANKVVEEVK